MTFPSPESNVWLKGAGVVGSGFGNVSPDNRSWLQKLEMNLMCLKKKTKTHNLIYHKEIQLYIESVSGL